MLLRIDVELIQRLRRDVELHRLLDSWGHESSAYRFPRCQRLTSRSVLAEFGPRGMVNNDCPPVRKRLHRMTGIARHDGRQTSPCGLTNAIDRYLKFAINHLVHLFFRMKVLVNRRSTLSL